jgi:hypothetical protein
MGPGTAARFTLHDAQDRSTIFAAATRSRSRSRSRSSVSVSVSASFACVATSAPDAGHGYPHPRRELHEQLSCICTLCFNDEIPEKFRAFDPTDPAIHRRFVGVHRQPDVLMQLATIFAEVAPPGRCRRLHATSRRLAIVEADALTGP